MGNHNSSPPRSNTGEEEQGVMDLLSDQLLLMQSIEYEFSSKLYKGLIVNNHEEKSNLIVSPISIFVTLCMVMCGANGKTMMEMAKSLSFGDDFAKLKNNELKRFMNDVIQHLAHSKETLTLANSIYVSNGVQIQNDFQQSMKDIFQADINQSDFTQPEKAASEINEWISEKTIQKINNLIDPSSINGSTKLILINAISFFGSWKNTFDRNHTIESGEFYTVNGVVIKNVPLMTKSQVKMEYGEDDGYKWVNLDYSEPGFGIKLVLPQTPKSKVSKKIESKFDEWIVKRLSQKSKVKFPTSETKIESFILPRFEVEYSTSLNEILQKAPFSLNSAFGQNADFSLMVKDNSVMIDKVFHKAVIKLNEEGTEAAAATYITMRTKSRGGPKPIVYRFEADQPFFYIITFRDHILFLGKIYNPLK